MLIDYHRDVRIWFAFLLKCPPRKFEQIAKSLKTQRGACIEAFQMVMALAMD